MKTAVKVFRVNMLGERGEKALEVEMNKWLKKMNDSQHFEITHMTSAIYQSQNPFQSGFIVQTVVYRS